MQNSRCRVGFEIKFYRVEPLRLRLVPAIWRRPDAVCRQDGRSGPLENGWRENRPGANRKTISTNQLASEMGWR